MRSIILTAIVALPLAVAACDSPSSVVYGESNSIIVAAQDSLWEAVADTVLTVLEPRIFTVRDERTFDVTHVAPTNPDWAQLRLWRQVLLLGRPGDPWLARVLEGRDEPLPPLPAVIEEVDVWARGQRVTALVLPEEGAAARAVELLPELHRLFDERFRATAVERMFTSGADTLLLDTLRAEAGFSLLVPRVYEWARVGGTRYHFWNDNENSGQLIRSVLVTWHEGVSAESTPESVLAWRDSVAAGMYDWAQTSDRGRFETAAGDGAVAGALEVHGIWSSNEGGFPMAGPFVARVVPCPEQGRTYLVDAWLYRPGRDKYEYMVQLETILDSFACGE